MKKVFLWVVIILVALTTLIVGSVTNKIIVANTKTDKKVLTITGSTSVDPYMNALKDVYKDKYSLKITANGSGAGIKAIIDKKTDVGMSSRELKPVEKQKTEAGNIKDQVIAFDGIAVVVSKNLPINNLSMKQIEGIFKGKIKDWSQINPSAKGQIQIIARDEKSGTREGFEKLIHLKKGQLPGDVLQIQATSEVIRTVNESKGAIGYVSSGIDLSAVKPVMVDNVKATDDNIKSKQYKLYRSFHLLYDANNKAAKEFIDVAMSEKAQSYLKNEKFKTNFIKVK